eukprot:m.27620 g.27620  ORF g.27620 m.27620 type:complete len:118 (+) comp30214_c0_seq1:982-1335(+)
MTLLTGTGVHCSSLALLQLCKVTLDCLVLPGEVDDAERQQDVPVSARERTLDISVSFRDPETESDDQINAGQMNNNESDAGTEDMVEPFSLAEDFDYDKVKLTPKYLPTLKKESEAK